MPITASALAHIATRNLDDYARGKLGIDLDKHKRPMWDAFWAKKDKFPGGKGLLVNNVIGEIDTVIDGIQWDDTATFSNPTFDQQAKWPYYFLHKGMMVTEDELHHAGIHVVDDVVGGQTVNTTDQEKIALTKMFEEKIYALDQGWKRGMDVILHDDGSANPKLPPGIAALISTTPTVGTIGGISRANVWWRNSAPAPVASTPATAGDQNIIRMMQREIRKLRTYGSGPNYLFGGTDYIAALEDEVRAKGHYTDRGFSQGKIDASVADLSFKGIEIFHDPTLDDLGKEKYCYALDISKTGLQLQFMDGHEMKTRAPNRPAEKYVLYRAYTSVAAITAKSMRTSAVWRLA